MSDLEETLYMHMKMVGLSPEREYRFCPQRRWRFDFAFPDHKLGIEVEGGVWVQGRHTRGAGYTADLEKYNTATLMGWRVLRVSGEMIENGEALGLTLEGLKENANGRD
jgi:very-short-patch-repair endonuclease